MNGIGYSDPGRLPSDEQRLMIEAALMRGPRAREAALSWLATADIARLGKASRRLLPLLCERFRLEGLEHPFLPVLKGVKRHTWYNNRLLFNKIEPVIRVLREAGIDVMVIKGAALTIEYYRDYSLRPMEDVDLLVRTEDASAAMDVLYRQGWKTKKIQGGLRKRLLQYMHALHFWHPSGHDLDLHWHMLPFCVEPNADADFWAASKEVTFESQTVRVLDPADQLLHICAHGAAWDIIAPVRWIPDAVAVLQGASRINWERLLLQTRRRKLTLLVRGALNYINRTLGALVPADVLREINRLDVSIFEKWEYRWLLKPCDDLLGVFPRDLCMFWRMSQSKTSGNAALRFPDYLCALWQVDRTSQLPVVFCKKAWRNIFA